MLRSSPGAGDHRHSRAESPATGDDSLVSRWLTAESLSRVQRLGLRRDPYPVESITPRRQTMATTIESQTAPVRGQPDSADQQVADIFVIFGITGDLAKVMTFRSLYRLERRGLLQCPIVGVAVNDWTMDQLVERARESIQGTGETIDPTIFDRFTARLSYVQGDFGDPATYQRVAQAIKGAEKPVFY